MCTYHISINDALIEKARPVIGNNKDVSLWMQEQVELLLTRMVESNGKQALDKNYMMNLIELSAPEWKGVADADSWVHELRG